MAALKRVIVETVADDSAGLDVGEPYWLCDPCLDMLGVDGDVVDQNEPFAECYVCGHIFCYLY